MKHNICEKLNAWHLIMMIGCAMTLIFIGLGFN
jgi:hypothetical protein